MITPIMLYSLIKLGKRGADFYIDYLYINTFAPEDIKDKVDQYTYIT